EHGDRGSAREWLARALHAPEDAAWAGEAYRSHRWSPINPVTGEFDALTWRAPGLRLAPVVVPSAPVPVPMAVAPIAEEKPVPVAEHHLRPQVEEDEALAVAPPLPDDPGPTGADEFDGDIGANEGQKW
ncbi:MAG: hypothetical protein WAW54_15105, partial [Parvibaculum sedimenti]